jgi:tetratricopeptide (TPR) repeat protein
VSKVDQVTTIGGHDVCPPAPDRTPPTSTALLLGRRPHHPDTTFGSIMTTGSATHSACPRRWEDLIPGPDFALDTVAALLGSTEAAREAITASLAAGTLVPLAPRPLEDLPRYRVVASHGNLVLPTDDERPAVLRMLTMLLRQLVGVDDRLNPGDYRSVDLADLADIPTFPDDAAAVRWFTAEFATIVAAQLLAAAMGEDAVVLWFGEASWAAATVTGRVRDMLTVQSLAAEAAEGADHPAAGIARARCCSALLELGRHQEALDAADHAWHLAEPHGHACSLAIALHAVGDANFALGRYNEALDCYRGARKIDAERVVLAADGSTTPLPMTSIGARWVAISATHEAMGWPAEAVVAATAAVGYLAEDHQRPRPLAQGRARLGQALLASGQPQTAIAVLTLAAAALDPAIDRHALAHINALLGEAALATGSSTTATRHFRAAAALFEQIGQPDRARAVRDRADADTPATDPLPAYHDEVRT